MSGMIRDANGSCIAPIVSNTGQIDCSAAANKVTTACGGNIAVQAPATATANTNNNWINCGVGFFYDEGIKGCKSTGAAGGVVNQVATIKCKDGSVRVTAIECDNVGGGSAGLPLPAPQTKFLHQAAPTASTQPPVAQMQMPVHIELNVQQIHLLQVAWDKR